MLFRSTYRVADAGQPGFGVATYALFEIHDSGALSLLGVVDLEVGGPPAGHPGQPASSRARLQADQDRLGSIHERNPAPPPPTTAAHLVKITVNRSGIVFVTAAQIAAAAVRGETVVQQWIKEGRLTLFHQGQPAGFWPEPDGSGIYFRGEAGLRPGIYMLGGGGPGRRPALPGGTPAAGEVSHTVAEIVVENDRTPALTLEAMGVDGMWMWGRAVAGNTSASRFTSGFELAGLDQIGRAHV